MKKSKLYTIKEPGFKTPDAYFDNFDDRLFKKLTVQREMSKMNGTGYKVPEHYFINFDVKLEHRLKEVQQPKVSMLTPWRSAAYMSAAAAVLVVMFTVFMKSDDNLSIHQVETASIENYLNNENMTPYDIASFLNAEDIILEDFVANIFTDESLENYLLTNASIEDLITEK